MALAFQSRNMALRAGDRPRPVALPCSYLGPSGRPGEETASLCPQSQPGLGLAGNGWLRFSRPYSIGIANLNKPAGDGGSIDGGDRAKGNGDPAGNQDVQQVPVHWGVRRRSGG